MGNSSLRTERLENVTFLAPNQETDTHIFRSNRALGNFYEHRNVTFCRDSKFSIYKPGRLYIESVFGQLSQDFFAFFHMVRIRFHSMV